MSHLLDAIETQLNKAIDYLDPYGIERSTKYFESACNTFNKMLMEEHPSYEEPEDLYISLSPEQKSNLYRYNIEKYRILPYHEPNSITRLRNSIEIMKHNLNYEGFTILPRKHWYAEERETPLPEYLLKDIIKSGPKKKL